MKADYSIYRLFDNYCIGQKVSQNKFKKKEKNKTFEYCNRTPLKP